MFGIVQMRFVLVVGRDKKFLAVTQVYFGLAVYLERAPKIRVFPAELSINLVISISVFLWCCLGLKIVGLVGTTRSSSALGNPGLS